MPTSNAKPAQTRGRAHNVTHMPKLTPKEVLDARARVLRGDLRNKTLKAVARDRAYRVGTGEMAQALGGFGRYQDYPDADTIDDREFLMSSSPGAFIQPENRTLFMKEQSVVERAIINQAHRQNGILAIGEVLEERVDMNKYHEPSEHEVTAIRLEYEEGRNTKEIAANHLMSEPTVKRMVYGMGKYSHLPSLGGGRSGRGGRPRKAVAAVEPIQVDTVMVEPVPVLEVRPTPQVYTNAEELLKSMLQSVGPQSLGWIDGGELDELAKSLEDIRAGTQMVNEAVNSALAWIKHRQESVK